MSQRPGRHRSAAISAALGLLIAVTGCTATQTAAPSTAPTVTTTSEITAERAAPSDTVDDLSSGSAHHQLAIDGESFRLKVDYFSTGDAKAWTSVGPKDVHLLAYVAPAADSTAPQVMIDDFQGQYRLLAENAGLDEVVIDETVDQAGANGFLITPKISYGSVVSTTGVTTELLARWQALGGRPPVDAAALQQAGVYGVAVTFTFRLLVRNAGDAGWHRRTVIDRLTVPVQPAPATTSRSATPTTG